MFEDYIIVNDEGLAWCKNNGQGFWSNFDYSKEEQVKGNYIFASLLLGMMKAESVKARLVKYKDNIALRKTKTIGHYMPSKEEGKMFFGIMKSKRLL